jgi:hypothetical protein
MLQHCLSKVFVDRMARYFGSDHLKPHASKFKDFLKRCFVNEMNAYKIMQTMS